MDEIKILVINPGSTSTKIAVYYNTSAVFIKTINHSINELADFKRISDQYEYRKELILKELEKSQINLNLINVVIGRGGIVKPIESGVYEVNEPLREDLKASVLGEHASNLGGLIADEIARSMTNVKAYIADPVVVDEMIDVARISGHPDFKRLSIFHALNHKAIGRAYAKSIKVPYEDLNLIIAHMGGGISVGAHRKGKVIDVNQALDGEGPFSPERSGTLPAGDLAKLCYSSGKTYDEIKKMITGKGGYVAYFGTNNAYDIETLAKSGNKFAGLIQNALAYQVGKAIGTMAAVLNGNIDAIILTGGIAYNEVVINYIKNMVNFIAPVIIFPGGDEMNALAMNAYLVLKGEIMPKIYK